MAVGNTWRFVLMCVALTIHAEASAPTDWNWLQLAPLPDREGFAGAFSGESRGVVIVGGGANFAPKSEGGELEKKWYDCVFALKDPLGGWTSSAPLPSPRGYGVSVTAPEGVFCMGGSDATLHYAEAFRMVWEKESVQYDRLPSLPRACANACGALVGRTIYMAGGLEEAKAASAMKNFWALDLDHIQAGWQALEPWPGPERFVAVAGAFGESFYLFSGARLYTDAEGKVVREYLKDAYRFTPGKGWERLPDLPNPTVAAPSPAPAMGGHGLLVLGGDTGAHVHLKPSDAHPGFSRNILLFDVKTEGWRKVGEMPLGSVTNSAVRWNERFVIPSGEVRPRVRTPQVWSVSEVK